MDQHTQYTFTFDIKGKEKVGETQPVVRVHGGDYTQHVFKVDQKQ